MKKKLEAELISIAHRILKLKNRAELDQLQQETLKLYEKISVLRFVEDNFSDVKPTIGYASAEETLEEVYGLEELPEVKANEVEMEEAKAKAEKDSKKEKKEAEKSVAKEETKAEPIKEEAKPEGNADPKQKVEEYQASEEEKEHTEEETDEEVSEEENKEDVKAEEAETPEKDTAPEAEDKPEDKEEKVEEPEVKIEVEKPAEEIKAMEESAEAVFTKEDKSTVEEEEKAADAEIVTIAPDRDAKVEDSGLSFDFAFERKPAPEEPQKQKEITFEDYKDYKEPEFIKKGDTGAKEEEKPAARDWRDWEPGQSGNTETAEPKAEEPKQEEKQPEPKPEPPKQEESIVKGNTATRMPDADKPRALNDSLGKTITLTLNDRIAFEKQLFGGSGEDLNRVLSQLNTINTFEEAKNFIEDLVKPDYNNWAGKDEYAERFMGIVEKKFD